MRVGEPALLRACIAGDNSAWKELVERYERLIFSIPRRYGLEREVSQDIFQEVFSILFLQLPRIKRQSGLPKWFITTTHRVCRQWLRQAQRSSGKYAELVEAPAPPPELVLLWERRQHVREALRRLGGRCEELLMALYTNQPVSYEDVARRLGMPLGSIGPMRARCLQKLMDVLRTLDREDRP